MANNYLQFSFAISVSLETVNNAAELSLAIAECREAIDWESEAQPLPAFDPWVEAFVRAYRLESVEYEAGHMGSESGVSLWFYAEECGNPEATADFIKRLMQLDPSMKPFAFTYAYTCSKMRVEEFGGGGIVITADRIYYKDASTWCNEALTAITEGREPT